LFSAVITAFLIESTKLLKQDPADVSAALLLLMAQSQRRMELNIPSDSFDPVETPAFSTSSIAVVINVLWFISLGLALISALFAMLAKEWLKHFREYPSDSIHRFHAFVQQDKLDGMRRWRGLEIIDLLPTILHFSLFLFGAGLVAFLWTINNVTAYVTLAMFALAAVLYVALVLLAAIMDNCPFITRFSRYLRLLVPSSNNRKCELNWDRTYTYQTVAAILQRFYNRAESPVVCDSVIQALSGLRWKWNLRLPNSSPPESHLCAFQAPVRRDSGFLISVLHSDDQRDSHQSAWFVDTLCERLKTVSFKPQQITSGGGENVGRYARALANFCTYISSCAVEWQDWSDGDTVS
jgi:hypothetical protein